MEKYDYMAAMVRDITMYIEDNGGLPEGQTRDEMAEKLDDELGVEDSVTGNGTGSYFKTQEEAEEALCHNLDLLFEAIREFGYPDLAGEKQPDVKALDVTIRCYLLYQAIWEVLERMGVPV